MQCIIPTALFKHVRCLWKRIGGKARLTTAVTSPATATPATAPTSAAAAAVLLVELNACVLRVCACVSQNDNLKQHLLKRH